MDLQASRIAVADVNHGGLVLAEELCRLGYDAFAVDVYGTRKPADTHIKVVRPDDAGQFDVLVAPVHMPPDTLTDYAGKAAFAGSCGLKIYLDATFGPLRVNTLPELAAHFEQWPGPGPIAVHAEETSVPVVLGLAATFNQRVHFCHVSRRPELQLIGRAKERGLPVTCEAAPHHLFLTAGDAARLGAFGQMRPPLQTEDDRRGLWELLDYVDCIATDHAPHATSEKEGAAPPPGVPGLETALPLMLTAVHDGKLTLDRLVDLMSAAPRRIFGLPPAEPDTCVEIDPDAAWEFPSDGWFTRAGWSPFAGHEVRGRVVRVRLRGREVYSEGTLDAEPGTGRVLF